MANKEGYITIAEAMAKYGHTRTWWDKQINDGGLVGYDIPGERATFLRQADVEVYLQPRPKAKRDDGDQVG
jgi:predicted DNA-binding transcriptional regulator AlpA